MRSGDFTQGTQATTVAAMRAASETVTAHDDAGGARADIARVITAVLVLALLASLDHGEERSAGAADLAQATSLEALVSR